MRGSGYTINKDGYIRIKHGRNRDQYYHRVIAAQCMKASGRVLTSEFEVDHLCGNRQCRCPDFHLLILPAAMAHVLNAGKGKPHRGRKNHIGV